MDAGFKDALFTFGRALFAAAVGAAVVYLTGIDLSAVTDVKVLAQGLMIAVINAVLLFLGAWLRNSTTEPVPVPQTPRGRADGVELAGPYRTRTRSWADWLPV